MALSEVFNSSLSN